MKTLIRPLTVAFALAAGLCVSGRSQGVEMQTNSIPGQTNALQLATNTFQLAQQFLAMQEQLQAETAAQDEQLRQLVAQMNSAPAGQKLDDVAAIVNKLVEERLASHQRKELLKNRILQALTETTGTNGVPQPVTNQPATNQLPPVALPPPSTQPVQPNPVTPQPLQPTPLLPLR